VAINNALFLLVIIVLIVIFLLIKRGIKGPAHSIDTILKPIDELLERGFDDGFLIISISNTKHFLQLRKYIDNNDDFGLELVFPKAEWSIEYFSKLEKHCIDEGIPYSIRTEVRKHTLDFLYIIYGNDSKKSYEHIRAILITLFGVDEETVLYLRMENAALS
jgi:hypothetical protein